MKYMVISKFISTLPVIGQTPIVFHMVVSYLNGLPVMVQDDVILGKIMSRSRPNADFNCFT